jgi:putative transposase
VPRVSPVERVRAEIDQLFADPGHDLGQVIEEVARLGARLLLQTALEAEVTAFLGRERYQRDPASAPGYRNGYQPVTVKTTTGPVTLARPKLRGTDQRFASQLLGTHVTRTNALEALVIAGFVRGLSTRDVEATLAEALGQQAALSRSTVSRICEAISGEFTAWSARSLADVKLDYLYVDGTHVRYHPGARAEPVLVAYGITATGAPVFLGLAPAGSEGHDPWVDFLADLTSRGLRSPVLVISDGAAGLLSAVEQAFPAALRQTPTVNLAVSWVAGEGMRGTRATARCEARPIRPRCAPALCASGAWRGRRGRGRSSSATGPASSGLPGRAEPGRGAGRGRGPAGSCHWPRSTP